MAEEFAAVGQPLSPLKQAVLQLIMMRGSMLASDLQDMIDQLNADYKENRSDLPHVIRTIHHSVQDFGFGVHGIKIDTQDYVVYFNMTPDQAKTTASFVNQLFASQTDIDSGHKAIVAIIRAFVEKRQETADDDADEGGAAGGGAGGAGAGGGQQPNRGRYGPLASAHMEKAVGATVRLQKKQFALLEAELVRQRYLEQRSSGYFLAARTFVELQSLIETLDPEPSALWRHYPIKHF